MQVSRCGYFCAFDVCAWQVWQYWNVSSWFPVSLFVCFGAPSPPFPTPLLAMEQTHPRVLPQWPPSGFQLNSIQCYQLPLSKWHCADAWACQSFHLTKHVHMPHSRLVTHAPNLSEFSTHVHTCAHGPRQCRRNAITATWRQILQETEYHTQAEQNVLFQDGTFKKKTDLTVTSCL